MLRHLVLLSVLGALVVAVPSQAAPKKRFTAHLTVRQQPGHPKQVTVATRFDVTFSLTGSALAWDGVFNQLSSFPFTVRLVFPGTRAHAVALCTSPWPPTIQCGTQQGEPLSAGITPVSGEVIGNATLNAAQRTALLAGKGIAVLGTTVNPAGEIRGPVKPR